ncbi:MAG: DUF2384 domain-containing protein [Candidatus Solibacter sp.]|nr:DUF2384 domain-containing protein [Candidatus Solibacter sp.]
MPERPDPEKDQEIRRRLAADVLSGMERWHTDSDRRRAKRYFFESAGTVEADENEINGFLQWYTHDFRDAATRRTLMEHYLETHGGQLPPRERVLVEAMRDSWPGVFEAESVEEGRGVHLRDLSTGEVIFVHDITSSRELVRGDCMLSRIEELDGKLRFVSNFFSVPPAVRDEFLKLIDKEARAAGQTRVEYVRRSGNLLYRKIRNLSDKWLKNLRVVNREGDALEFCRADYSVLDEPSLLARLRSLAELKEEPGKPGEAHFAWLETVAQGPRPVYGHVQVGGGHLRLEAQSRTRLQLGRGLLESHAAGLLKHQGDSYQSLDEIKQQIAASREPVERDEPIPTEREREIILQMKAQHYSTWADDPLPALGGKTAREAVKTESGRKAVQALIRDMEHGEARGAKDGQPGFDFTPIRKTLGLGEK